MCYLGEFVKLTNFSAFPGLMSLSCYQKSALFDVLIDPEKTTCQFLYTVLPMSGYKLKGEGFFC